MVGGRDGRVDRRVVGGRAGLARALDRGRDRQAAVAVGLHAAQRLDVPAAGSGGSPTAVRCGLGEAVALLPHADRPGGEAGLLRDLPDAQQLVPRQPVRVRFTTGESGVIARRGPRRRVPATMIPSATPKPSCSPAPPATSAASCSPRCSTPATTCAAWSATRRAPTCPDGGRRRRGRRPRRRGAPRGARGVDVAYYLVHSMGGAGGDFAAADREAAADVRRRRPRRRASGGVVYLGGLEGGPTATSEHLRSRDEVAAILAERVRGHGPRPRRDGHRRRQRVVPDAAQPRRAPAGDGLPALDRHPHPARGDRATSSARSPRWPCATDPPAEVELGGADVLTYREMMGRFAADRRARRRRVIVKVPGAHAAPVVLLGRPRDARSTRAWPGRWSTA